MTVRLQGITSALNRTEARRRMVAIASSALLFSLFSSATEVIFPLWVSGSLGYSASEWAHLRSLRMGGALAGVVVLGALSDRFGARLLGALSMLGTAAVLVALGLGPSRWLWPAMPLFGALVSTAFVNLNTLTQHISDRHQGAANSIYRSVGALAAVVAPVLATAAAAYWNGYPPVLVLVSGLLVIAAVLLMRYPENGAPRPLGPLSGEVIRLWTLYSAALRQRQLVAMVNLQMLWSGALAGVGTFMAIRFTQQLGRTDQEFGAACAIAGIASFVATAAAGLFLDRTALRDVCMVGGVLASVCTIVMGATDSPALTMVAFVAYAPVTTVLIAPFSMWVSRAAGSASQAAAFSVHKVIQAAYVAATMALLGFLEQRTSIRAILFYGGILGLGLGLLFRVLPEPPRPQLAEGAGAPEDARIG